MYGGGVGLALRLILLGLFVRAEMPGRLHSVMEQADDLDQAGLVCPVEDNMHRVSYGFVVALGAAMTDV